MYKMIKQLSICCVIAAFCWCLYLVSQKQTIVEGLIRFHVVANSDSAEDQAVKLKVRDAVLESILMDLQSISDISQAKRYLQENIPKIETIVNYTLKQNGYPEISTVSLCRERFDIRHYETFSLPAGIYDSLRIIIGEGNGHNWWCVAFPTLCVPATSSGFEAAAVSAGFSESIAQTLSTEDGYTIQFYLLNQLGKLENIFFGE